MKAGRYLTALLVAALLIPGCAEERPLPSPPTTADSSTTTSRRPVLPAAIYRDQCGICHGDFGEGTSIGGELVDVASRHDEESLSTIVTSGVGVMPGTPSISDEELQAIVSYVLDNL